MERLPITGLPVGQVPLAFLVCGDPGRAATVAERLEQVKLLSDRREYRTYSGQYNGVAVAVCSHGVGAPGAAIAFEEIIAAGGQRLIRVGTCGSLQPDIHDGDLIIATAAVDRTGYGRLTVPDGYPAVADFRLVQALVREARRREATTHPGIVLTSDGFYGGVDTPHTPHYPTLSRAGVLAVEMECAALFQVGSLRGVQTAAILAVDGNVLEEKESMDSYDPHRQVVTDAVVAEIEIALRAATEPTVAQ
ncbi:MAG: nucleoside phosphorylase [Candidatus Promineifilaceae bacterium]|nr:nucleoside phosphorylase [Candidatus Promineifilaceae bacterium]